jgi:hypothetical protein
MNDEILIELGEVSQDTKGGSVGGIEFVTQPKLD